MIDQFVRNADQLQMLHSSLRMWSSIQNSHLARLTPMTQEVFQETKKKKKMWFLGEYLHSDQHICQLNVAEIPSVSLFLVSLSDWSIDAIW